MGTKRKYHKRLKLYKVIGQRIFNAINAGEGQNIGEKFEITRYHTLWIIDLIHNNYRRRNKEAHDVKV